MTCFRKKHMVEKNAIVLIICCTGELSQNLGNIADTVEEGFREKVDAEYYRLVAGECTQNNVRSRLQIIADFLSQPNKRAYVYYNGHGDWRADTNGDEADGMDEFWKLSDGSVVLDDYISTLFNQINESSFLFLVNDHCSSGTMLDRSLNDRPWICLSSSQDSQDSLSTYDGGVFTLFGFLPAIQRYDTLREIVNYISENIDIPTQNFRVEFTRNYLETNNIWVT